jgi:GntR family histidine utilization transcriptional repressor
MQRRQFSAPCQARNEKTDESTTESSLTERERDEHPPIFQQIKDYLQAEIADGRWKAGDMIPSEQSLLIQFGVSRMTVNRAVRELAAEHVLTRRQGAGTFVAHKQYRTPLLAIRDIAADILARGHRHRSNVQLLESCTSSDLMTRQFALAQQQPLFHSVIVHFDNAMPIQVEECWVNPACAPDYLQQDFSIITPSDYLSASASLQDADCRIEALAAPREIADMLAMEPGAPCLVLWKSTRSNGEVASIATMWHPGHRHQFTGSLA